jgi:hypothetical protein
VYQWIWRSKCQMKHKVFFGCFWKIGWALETY